MITEQLCNLCGMSRELTCSCCGCICPKKERPDLQPEKILELQAKLGSDQNPKDIVARKKVSVSKLPLVATLHAAHAMMDGARKYGPYNWRQKKVFASVYVDAALRHIAAYFEREDRAADSGVHHLGHAMACCAILLDAEACGMLVDDRPLPGAPITEILAELMTRIESMPTATVKSDPGVPT